MSEKLTLDVNVTEAERTLKRLNDEIEGTERNLIDMAEDVVIATQKSFNEVMGMMRASYMMVTGISQVAGGGLSQVFESLFSLAISTIGTYQAIAAAIAATPGGQIQAVLMLASLMTAVVNLGNLTSGQTELSRRITGLNMSLHAIGSMIGGFHF